MGGALASSISDTPPVSHTVFPSKGLSESVEIFPEMCAELLRRDDGISRHLSSMHDSAFVRGESISPVHDTPVVPDNQITRSPAVAPDKLLLCCVCPKLIEKCFPLLGIHVDNGLIRAPSEIEHRLAGVRMTAHQRVGSVL